MQIRRKMTEGVIACYVISQCHSFRPFKSRLSLTLKELVMWAIFLLWIYPRKGDHCGELSPLRASGLSLWDARNAFKSGLQASAHFRGSSDETRGAPVLRGGSILKAAPWLYGVPGSICRTSRWPRQGAHRVIHDNGRAAPTHRVWESRTKRSCDFDHFFGWFLPETSLFLGSDVHADGQTHAAGTVNAIGKARCSQ